MTLVTVSTVTTGRSFAVVIGCGLPVLGEDHPARFRQTLHRHVRLQPLDYIVRDTRHAAVPSVRVGSACARHVRPRHILRPERFQHQPTRHHLHAHLHADGKAGLIQPATLQAQRRHRGATAGTVPCGCHAHSCCTWSGDVRSSSKRFLAKSYQVPWQQITPLHLYFVSDYCQPRYDYPPLRYAHP